jgi:hypothetical protein
MGKILCSKAVSGPSVFTKRTVLMFMDMGLIWDSYGINIMDYIMEIWMIHGIYIYIYGLWINVGLIWD